MNKRNIFCWLMLAIIIVSNVDCTKEGPGSGSSGRLTAIAPPPPPPPPLPPSKNTAPNVNAGSDIILTLPLNEVTLNATCVDAENNIQGIEWKKITGPGPYNLNTANLLQPRLTQLVKGEYEFELTAFDSLGLYDRDTVNILVRNAPIVAIGTVIFEDQTWIFPWYPSVEVKDFHSWVPPGVNFTVFIKRDANQDWIEVSPVSSVSTASYEYFVETRPDGAGIYTYGSLYIFSYTGGVDDTPDVKILY